MKTLGLEQHGQSVEDIAISSEVGIFQRGIHQIAEQVRWYNFRSHARGLRAGKLNKSYFSATVTKADHTDFTAVSIADIGKRSYTLKNVEIDWQTDKVSGKNTPAVTAETREYDLSYGAVRPTPSDLPKKISRYPEPASELEQPLRLADVNYILHQALSAQSHPDYVFVLTYELESGQ